MRRLPIRVRLTLAFAGVMTIVLAATGLFLHLRMTADFDRSLDNALRARTGDIGALVQQSEAGLREAARNPAAASRADVAQILDTRGRIFDATAGLGHRRLLTPARLRRAVRAPVVVPRVNVSTLTAPVRLLATPVRAQDRSLVIVAGVSLADRDRALSDLTTLLLIGGPAALLLASLAGYGLATAALRPVERMRRRAREISTEALDQRLPLSPGHDELRRLGETLNGMLDRLQSGVEHEREFVADASHELRTPLAVLRAELELMARDRPVGRRLDAATASAIEETKRLQRLTDDLLTLARADRGGLPMDPELLDARELLAATMRRFRETARSRGREIGVDAPEGLTIAGDRDRLDQALGGLVDNALRHGGGPITLAARGAGDAVDLIVADRGPGLPEDLVPRAFERFTRADPARGDGGVGLGLAIVRAIAEGHGGLAVAANDPRGGARVTLTLPAVRAGGEPTHRLDSDRVVRLV